MEAVEKLKQEIQDYVISVAKQGRIAVYSEKFTELVNLVGKEEANKFARLMDKIQSCYDWQGNVIGGK